MGKMRTGASFPQPPYSLGLPDDYALTLTSIKEQIENRRLDVVLTANSALVMLYWEIGTIILDKQERAGWGTKVVDRLSYDLRSSFPDMKGFSPRNLKYMRAFAAAWPQRRFVQELLAQLMWYHNIRLSKDIRNELPEVKGFSERNLKLMVQFYHEYSSLASIGQSAVAQLDTTNNHCFLVLQIPWGHNVLLMEKIKAPAVRAWYMQQTLKNGWSRNILKVMISSRAYERQGKAVSNFEMTLPQLQSDLVQQAQKDLYVFDSLTRTSLAKEASVNG